MSAEPPVIVWFRQELRLSDNPALHAAVSSGRAVLPVFILDDNSPGVWRAGGAARWWLHHSLVSLQADLNAAGAPLLLRRGLAEEVLTHLAAETGADTVYWNRAIEPWASSLERQIGTKLSTSNVSVRAFGAALLTEPSAIQTKSGGPYKVFTPFWNALQELPPMPPPLPPPNTLRPHKTINGDTLDQWDLLPTRPDWAGGLRETWIAGETAAHAQLAAFLDDAVAAYPKNRDFPALAGTSRLSPYLHWGEISARQMWSATSSSGQNRAEKEGRQAIRRQLAWREFNHHLLAHFPDMPEENWKSSYDAFPWRQDNQQLAAWQRGETGYPLVDAGMRELWHTGWMHNRARMVAASFLVKHLLIDWRAGAAWFWDTLVDADLANNSANWQWVAGSGADAAPYFRIFNPARQGARFDPEGDYVRRWLPELQHLPGKWIHEPARAPAGELTNAGIQLGKDYPAPIVDHDRARERALAAYQQSKAPAAAL